MLGPLSSTRVRGLAALAAALVLPSCAMPTADREPIGRSDEALVVCADGETTEGIDVSSWQGDIDWGAVRSAGIDFAIVRVSDGSYEDPKFDRNWSGARANGIVRGVYQFFRPGQDPIAQADLLVRRMGELQADDLSPTLDVEATDGQSASTIASRISQWVARIEERTGRTPMVYTGKYFWNDHVGTDMPDLPLWIAAWGPPCPDTPRGWGDWHFWQYSSTGSVAGISGDVDRDMFNGSVADLMAFARTGGSARYGAEYVDQSWPLAADGALEVPQGTDVPIWIELRNTGSEPWDGSTRFALADPRDRTSPLEAADWLAPSRPDGVEGTVAPGDTYRFEFSVHGSDLGDYDEKFGLVQEGVTWFSDPGEGGPPDGYIEGRFTVVPGPEEPDAGMVGEDDAGAPVDDDAGVAHDDDAGGGGDIHGGDAGAGDPYRAAPADARLHGGCSAAGGPGAAGGPSFAMLAILLLLGVRRGRST